MPTEVDCTPGQSKPGEGEAREAQSEGDRLVAVDDLVRAWLEFDSSEERVHAMHPPLFAVHVGVPARIEEICQDEQAGAFTGRRDRDLLL